MREHEFDINGNVGVHRPSCWCSWWEQAVRDARARNRQAQATDEPDEDDESEVPWWKK